jgi:hypothetical protein
MKKTGGLGDICNIYYYNREDFDTAIIKSKNECELIFISFNMFGEYNGYIYQNYKEIENIWYDDSYIPFYKKIIDKSTINSLNLSKKEDFINYALNNNRILAILKEDNAQYEDFDDVKVLDFDGKYLKYQKYERWAKLRKRIYKLKISKIVMLQVDSKYQRLLERVREDNVSA